MRPVTDWSSRAVSAADAVALVSLVLFPMPPGNAEIVKLIAAGFLGALTQGHLTGGSQ